MQKQVFKAVLQGENKEKRIFFKKKDGNVLAVQIKSLPLQPQMRNNTNICSANRHRLVPSSIG